MTSGAESILISGLCICDSSSSIIWSTSLIRKASIILKKTRERTNEPSALILKRDFASERILKKRSKISVEKLVS